MRCSFLVPVLMAGAAAAEDCPPVPDISARIEELTAAIQAAPDEQTARPITARMWQLWTRAPDARAQALLDEGIARIRLGDFTGAETVLTDLVRYCPDYAEGHNQRAFARFLRKDFAAALPDLDRALALSPHHIGAMTGRALTLMGLDRMDEAQQVLREALTLNPWLSERAYLIDPPGEDL